MDNYLSFEKFISSSDYTSLQSSKSNKLTPKTIGNYMSYLRSASKAIFNNEDKLSQIEDESKLAKLHGRLIKGVLVLKKSDKWNSNVECVFRIYVEFIKFNNRLNILKQSAELYLSELIIAYHKLIKNGSNKKKMEALLLDELSLLFEPNQLSHIWSKEICKLLKANSQKGVKLIYQVSQELIKGNKRDMIETEIETTAKVMAIITFFKSVNRPVEFSKLTKNIRRVKNGK